MEGIEYKGRLITEGSGLYYSDSTAFFRGGLPGLSRCLKCNDATCVCVKDNKDMAKRYRIRKLTPKECFRLMGVRDGDIDAIMNSGVSNSQQYKMAGNSIVVDVLMGIFKQVYEPKLEEGEQLSLF